MKVRLFFIVLLIVSFVAGIFSSIDFFNSIDTLNFSISGRFVLLLFIGIFFQMMANMLRAFKSQLLLNKIRKSKFRDLFKGLSVGYLFNALLPFRLGEVARAIYTGDLLSISKTVVFVSIIFERIVDGLILGILSIVTSLIVRDDYHTASVAFLVFGVFLVAVSIFLLLIFLIAKSENRLFLRLLHYLSSAFNTRISNRIRFMAWSGIYGSKVMLADSRVVKRYVMFSLLMWSMYFGSIFYILQINYPNLNIKQVVWGVQAAYASVTTPFGPGNIETFAKEFSDLLSKVGFYSNENSIILVWVVMVIPISITGLYIIFRQRFGPKNSASSQKALINKLYRDKDISEELGHFLDAYLKGEKINHLLTQAELEDKFKLIKSFKGGSNAHTMLVWQNKELRVKKITLIQYAEKLEEQANWLIERAHLKHLPRVTYQEKTDSYYYFDLNYLEDYYPFFDYIHSHSSKENFTVLKGVLRFVSKDIYIHKSATNGLQNVNKYIDQKVLGKVNDTANMSTTISNLLLHDSLVINGTKYLNIPKIINLIKKHKQAMRELSLYREGPIHGDLTIDNLITSSKGDFLLLDPNNENQVSAAVVDYGKMYQSLHSGYEFLIQLDTCLVRDNIVTFEDSVSHKYAELYTMLRKKLQKDLAKEEYRSILFHEAVHYCRMLTYRATINPETVPVFYATAVKLFNEYLEQYKRRVK